LCTVLVVLLSCCW